MIKKNNRRTVTRPILISLIVLLAIGCGLTFWLTSRNKNKPNLPAANGNVNSIDLSPATEQEQQESNQRKEESAKQEEIPSSPSGPKKTVTPVIVDANQYDQKIEVRAYIPGIFEDGGTCTSTFTKGATIVKKSVSATKDATTSRCDNLTFDKSELAPGVWTVVVGYSSLTSEGDSRVSSLEVK
jgi:hypothetical protein